MYQPMYASPSSSWICTLSLPAIAARTYSLDSSHRSLQVGQKILIVGTALIIPPGRRYRTPDDSSNSATPVL